jgi:hypothetical protein
MGDYLWENQWDMDGEKRGRGEEYDQHTLYEWMKRPK